MPFFSGMAAGINEALTSDRLEQMKLNEAQAQRENAILQHLTTSDDTEIAARALTGLLNQHRKPSKGLRGFLSESEENPMLPTIRELIQKGRQVPNAGQPEPNAPPEAPAPPAGIAELGGAALPAGSPVELGVPSMRALASPPPGPVQFHEGPSVGTHTEPRQAFLPPMERARQMEELKVSAPLHALSGYLSPEQMRTAALGKAGVHVPMTGQFMGNQQKPDGSWVRQERYFDQSTGTFQLAEVPIATPTGLQVKPTTKAMAGPDGRPRLYRIMPDNTKQDLGELPVKDGYVTYTDPDTQQVVSIPAPAIYEKPRGAIAPGAAAAPPPAAGTAPAVRGGGAIPRAAVPPPAPGTSPAPAAGPRGVARGRTRSLEQVEGAMLGPDGEPRVVTAQYDKGTGKYFDPTNPGQEFQGFIPGKEGPELVKAVSGSLATESTLDRAIQAITEAGLATNNDPNKTAELVNKYRSGTAGNDPVTTAVNALASFAQIQGGGQYIQGTRSFQYIKQIQQHLPVLPSIRDAAITGVTGIGPASGPGQGAVVRAVAPGMSWDSPASMVEKLQIAKANLQNVRKYAVQAGGKTPERAIGTGKGPPGVGGPATMQKPIPGILGGVAESRDGGKTWQRVK